MNSERQHAVLSASSSDRWIHCPPSVRLSEGFEDKGSDYALEGTCAHALAEYKLRKALGYPAQDPTEALAFYNEEMEEATDGYVSYVLEKVEAAKEACSDPVVLVEQRVDYSRWVKQGFGTADALIIADGTLRIIDLKYGTGIEVSAEDNPQLKCYSAWSLGSVRRHLRHRHRQHDDSTSRDGRTSAKWQISKNRPARMGRRGSEAYGGAGLGRQGGILLRPVVPVLQGEDHLPETGRGEPEARAA
jgi:hypothetical protein